MSLNRHSNITIRSLKLPTTPLKASVAILTAIILSSCATGDGAPSYTFNDVFGVVTNPNGDDTSGGDTNGGDTDGGDTDGGDTGGGDTGGGDTGGGDIGGGDTGGGDTSGGDTDGGDTDGGDTDGGDTDGGDTDGGDTGGGDTGGGNTGGGDTDGGNTGGGDTDGGDTGGGNTGGGDTGGGDTGGGDTGGDPGGNQPEADKTGVQSININADPLGAFNTTTRDFTVSEDGSVVDARADIATTDPKKPDDGGLLPKVPVTISGANDTELADGFKSHKDSAVIEALNTELPLNYVSVYKDFGKDMRIGHIDGAADATLLIGKKLPVDGVAVTGNATQAANVPTDGTAKYTGDATYRKLGLDNDIEFGTSVFTADFVGKKVAGDLKFAKAGDIGLTADINGNKFSGSAADNAGYNTEGGFYGGDAGYLGGIYEGNDAQGTYGAERVADTGGGDTGGGDTGGGDTGGGDTGGGDTGGGDTGGGDTGGGDTGGGDTGGGDTGGGGDTTPTPPENPVAAVSSDVTGIMSNTLSSKDEKVFGIQATVDRIGYRQFVTDNETFTEVNEDPNVPGENAPNIVKDQSVDNLPSYSEFNPRVDITSPDQFAKDKVTKEPTDKATWDNITTVRGDDVDAGNGFKKSKAANNFKFTNVPTPVGAKDLDLDYQSVYKNFDSQMQIGHVYGDISLNAPVIGGVKSRYSNVYAIGNSTAQVDMDYMKALAQFNKDNNINDGTFQYTGVATYIDKLHLGAGDRSGPVLDGTSEFKVDFVTGSLEGNLNFGTDKDIGIGATIDGNTFTGTKGKVETAGGFFGEDAKFLGGIYQENQGTGGSGTTPGTGTTFQGTFGAEKQK